MAAGFVEFEITWRADVFGGAPQSSSAADFGTEGINFRARKAATQQEWEDALRAQTCAISPTFASRDTTHHHTGGHDNGNAR